MHKRKHRKSFRDGNWDQPTRNDEGTSGPDPCLYIQAHEADIIRGPSAAVARLLEYPTTLTPGTSSKSGLIRWGAEHLHGTDTIHPQESDEHHLWVDRFDVRLLLDHLPDRQTESTSPRPLSPSGWSDLPSDSEDTFFFSPDELDDYRREKRRRLIDRGREERLKALAAIDLEENPDPWGGSDEEPDETQRELMRRTASHITSSPNPGQLEMRILANYGTEKRFAFLRGRWSRAWKTEKERARQCREKEVKKTQPLPTALASLGGLANYGDSDSSGEELEDEPTGKPDDATDTTCTRDSHSNEDELKEARRARAREWSARRRAEQSSQLKDT